MILLAIDFLQVFADIIGAILTFLSPVVSPIGAWMVDWIEVVLKVFPDDSLSLYIAVFIVLIVVGAIVNSLWTGDAPPKFLTHKVNLTTIPDEKLKEVEEIEDLSNVSKDNDDRKSISDHT
ncbi:MAG: hypothetical protein MUP85_19060 [Candidatus Lokiarchaeota archaeon]|nr:hypothetical protein [Candidatus Lokiarchaeota archaeon]